MDFIIAHWLHLSVCTITILLAVVFTQWLSNRNTDKTFLARKILHIVSVGLCSYTIQVLGNTKELAVIFLIASLLLAYEVKMKKLNISDGKSYGIALFPLGFGILLLSGIDFCIVAISGYILTFSDAFAGLVGKSYGNSFFTPFKEEKSLLGSFTFFSSSAFILYTLNWFDLSFAEIMFIAIMVSVAEMFSWRGSDNLTILLTASISIWVLS